MTSLFGGGTSLVVGAAGSVLTQQFTPTDGQTTFTLSAFSYVPNTASLWVFVNGSKQRSGLDFTETSASSFTLTFSVLSTDVVEVIGFPAAKLTVSGLVSASSNFVPENQTAIAGQTVFTLTTAAYTPGSNSLVVYMNGLKLRKGADYAETSTTSITLVNAASKDDELDFIIGAPIGAAISAGVVGFTPAGVGSTATDVQSKLREIISIKDSGAVSGQDLSAAFALAISNLPSTGGIIDCQMLQGAQVISSKVTVNKPNVTILFGSATYTLSGVAATQSPFGAQFYITSPNVWLVGNYSTKFFMAAGARADAIGFLHGSSLGGIIGIELDGNKANNSGQVDDTFQSGIQIINAVAGGGTSDARITVQGCNIHDFIHYGIVTYGDLSNGNIIQNNLIHDNGKAADALSTGDGIYINKGSGLNLVTGNKIYSNKLNGIHITTAGTDQKANKVIDNWCYSNGQHGIFPQEQANLGSISGVGQTGLILRGNHCYSNTQDGIRIGTYDNVGYLKNTTIEGNQCYSNSGYGILLQSTADATNNLRQTLVANNQVYSNTLDGIAVAANVLDTTVNGNTSIGNSGTQIVNSGVRTLLVVNKDSITAPVWYETGTWTPTDGSGAALSITVAAATYVKIGKMVYATFAITYPSTANVSGARLTGLPYTSQNSAAGMHPVSIGFTTAAASITANVDSNAKSFAFFSFAGVQSTNQNLSTAIIRGTAIYEVA